MSRVAAIDLGASSGRVIVGGLDGGQVRLETVARFPNTPIVLPDGLHWDVPALYAAAMAGVGAASRTEELAGIAVDSWAVDYGLTRGDALLGLPRHYRDGRHDAGVEAVHAVIDSSELYRRSGLAHQAFNTVFQLAAESRSGLLDVADGALLIPDLIGYWVTGERVSELTNASTTGLLPVGGDVWDTELLTMLALPALFPDVVAPGTDVGPVSPRVRQEFGIEGTPRLSAVGSHDTASAVVGVPLRQGLQHESRGGDAAYISCGTWSLVGSELDAPIKTEHARQAGFTNEGGVDGRTRFLKNVMGLWVLSESIRAWEHAGHEVDLSSLLSAAAQVGPDVPTFDVDDPQLRAPGDMPARIASVLSAGGSRAPTSRPELVRSVLASLAKAYAATIADLERLTGDSIRAVHLVGGGARNELLCQLTADTVGVPVIAGPVEATAIGNVLVQLRTVGALTGDLEDLRRVTARSFSPRTYDPRPTSRRG